MEIKELKTAKSIENWSSVPGNIDSLKTSVIYPSSNDYGIPDLLFNDFVPVDLVPYGQEIRRPKVGTLEKTIHFFLEDYIFEPVWNRPNKTLSMILKVGRALSPDFSLYVEYPLAIQIWNTYRNRYIARFWQEYGVQVIPTIAWGDKRSYDFCFLGVPKHSPVAIGTVGLRSKESKKLFCEGFEKMCEVIEPCRLIVYGEIEPLRFEDYVANVHRYETYWKKKRGELSGR